MTKGELLMALEGIPEDKDIMVGFMDDGVLSMMEVDRVWEVGIEPSVLVLVVEEEEDERWRMN